MLASSTNGTAATIQTMLLQFLSDPRLQDQFNGSDSSGKYAENPAQLVGCNSGLGRPGSRRDRQQW